MRRHAKASSAGSTSGKAAGLGSVRRGDDTTRASSLSADGSGALSQRGRLALALIAAVGAFFALAPGAQAAQVFVKTATVGPNGTAGDSFGIGGSVRLAFDQAGKKLYALDVTSPAKIYGFNVATPGAFTPLTSPFPLVPGGTADITVDNSGLAGSTGRIYTISATALSGFNSAGTALTSPFPITPPNPKTLCGLGVDSAGNIAIGNSNNTAKKVLRYSSAGSALTSISTAAQGNGLACRVAFDSNDDLYVALTFNGFVGQQGVWKYTAASGYASGSAIQVGPGSDIANAIAVDKTTHHLYVAAVDKNTFSQVGVKEYDSSGNPVRTFATPAEIPGEGLTGVTVNETTHEVYVADGSNKKIYVYGFLTVPDATTGAADNLTPAKATLHGTVNPLSAPVTDCHFEYTTDADFQANGFAGAAHSNCASNPGSGSSNVAVSTVLTGLDPGTDYKFRLIAANANGSVPGSAAAFTTLGPQIRNQSSSDPHETTVTLSAEINPNGDGTAYHFEYVTEAQFDQSGYATASAIPAGIAGIGSGSSYVPVSQPLSGLAPGTVYHFRAVATNLSATFTGPDTVFGTYAVDAVEGNCPNAALRSGPSALLPDCRAYEQVSPLDKSGFDIAQAPIVARPDGAAVAYPSIGAFSNALAGAFPNSYSASRAASWQTKPLIPPFAPNALLHSGNLFGASGDQTKQLVGSDLKLTPDAIAGNINLYIHDSSDDSYQLVATTTNPSGDISSFAAGVFFDGASYDGSRFYFTVQVSASSPALDSTPPPPPLAFGTILYEFSGGQLKLVGIRPDDTVDPGSSRVDTRAHRTGQSNLAAAPVFRAVSENGERVYFTLGGPLAIRQNGHTTMLPGFEDFWYASTTGSVAYTTSSGKLTPDASPAGTDLYRYDAVADQLTDLTPDAVDPGGAGVQGVLGTSDDGTYVYFVANGALAPGASPGSCNYGGATTGACNVYAWHNGSTRFVGRVASKPEEILGAEGVGGSGTFDGLGLTGYGNYRVSSNGRYLGFLFSGQLTGPHPQGPQSFRQAYLYDYQADSLACASCPPAGVDQTGDVRLDERQPFAGGTVNNLVPFAQYDNGMTRNVSNSGQFFFESPDRLLTRDTNGEGGCPLVDVTAGAGEDVPVCLDVYEYEAGQVHLLSTGTSPDPSFFGDASASGDDVFISTHQASLVGQDTDPLTDLYDARVGGGLASQNPAAQVSCQGEGCRNAGTSALNIPGAGSAAFQGPGNPPAKSQAKRCPRGKRKVRRHGKVRCVPRKHHKRAHHRTANHNRRAAR